MSDVIVPEPATTSPHNDYEDKIVILEMTIKFAYRLSAKKSETPEEQLEFMRFAAEENHCHDNMVRFLAESADQDEYEDTCTTCDRSEVKLLRVATERDLRDFHVDVEYIRAEEAERLRLNSCKTNDSE